MDQLQDSVIALKHSFFIADELWELIKGDNPCSLVPEDVCALGVCVPVRVPCNIIRQITVLFAYFVRTTIKLSLEIVESRFETESSRPSDGAKESLRIEAIFDNLKSFDSWTTVALETVNKNMVTQHTEMRSQLQTRHTEMVNNINEWTTKVGNYLGDYTETVTTTLGDHHQSLSDKLDVIEDDVGEVNSTVLQVGAELNVTMLAEFHGVNNELDNIELALAEVLKDVGEVNSTVLQVSAGLNVTMLAEFHGVNSELDNIDSALVQVLNDVHGVNKELDNIDSALAEVLNDVGEVNSTVLQVGAELNVTMLAEFHGVNNELDDIDLAISDVNSTVLQVGASIIDKLTFEYSSGKRFAGCDGIDQDLDETADNCAEDL